MSPACLTRKSHIPTTPKVVYLSILPRKFRHHFLSHLLTPCLRPSGKYSQILIEQLSFLFTPLFRCIGVEFQLCMQLLSSCTAPCWVMEHKELTSSIPASLSTPSLTQWGYRVKSMSQPPEPEKATLDSCVPLCFCLDQIVIWRLPSIEIIYIYNSGKS